MKIVGFRIKNYKSIVDSSWCQLASDCTVLAGKNESGKTAILEALRDFDPENDISPQSLPINSSARNSPEISVCFEIEKNELQQILEQKDIMLNKEAYAYINENSWRITIHKNSDEYWLDEAFVEILDELYRKRTNARIVKIKNQCENLARHFNLQCPDIDTTRDDQDYWQAMVEQLVQEVISHGHQYDPAELRALCEEFGTENLSASVSNVLIENIPPFIFFDNFSNILPFEISTDTAKENEAFTDFSQVAGLNLDQFFETSDRQRRRNMLSRCSASVSGDFHEYWKQDKLNLKVEVDGETFRVGVENEGETTLFSLGQRSKGFQWFMSFYLRLKAKESRPGVILIDEPGMYLHAQAQHDVLKTLENLSETSTIIFSTHSPYLIDHQRLDRIRLVQKNNSGTIIENKIHRNTNTETLTPVMTAIGLSLENNGFSVVGQKNVLLEGISDYYYLQALRPDTLGEEIKFIPCVGATKIPQLASLLIGWGLQFHILLDNDRAGRNVQKSLQKMVPNLRAVSFISSTSDTAIEDLFTREDFNKFVIAGFGEQCEKNVQNTQHLKKQRENLNKVLLAKNFFEKSNKNSSIISELCPETVSNFKGIFDAIHESFLESNSIEA